MFLSSLYICKALQKFKLNVFFFFFFACASKKWQNNQRIYGGRILVEVEVEVDFYLLIRASDILTILNQYFDKKSFFLNVYDV